MGIYFELLDTAWTAREGRAAALALLKLRALTADPCELTTSHAIASILLLDDCAPDPCFRLLVQNGRIRFRRRPNGDGPRAALINGLRDRNYRLDTWPWMWPEEESTKWAEAAERREAAIAVLSGKARRTGDTSTALDERLENAIALIRAIETADYTRREQEDNRLFQSLVRNANQYIAGDYLELRSIVERLGNLPMIDRSAVYEAIERDSDCTTELERQAKQVIDALKSRAMAYALEEKLFSVEREVKMNGAFHASDRPEPATVSVEAVDEGTNVPQMDLDGITIEWRDVYAATEHFCGRSPSRADLQHARDKLVQALMERRMAIPSRQISAVVGKGVTAVGAAVGSSAAVHACLVPTLGATLGAWCVAMATGIASLLGVAAAAAIGHRLSEKIKEGRKERVAKAFTCWMDPPEPGRDGPLRS